MSFRPESLAQSLASLGVDSARRFVVAFSGGLDSTALLHALWLLKRPQPLLAVHVDHQLHPSSPDWDRHCERFCAARDIDYVSLSVAIDDASGLGLEAAARAARYAAIANTMQTGDCLLSAHHQDDQGETLLLNLMRGSGALGLAGIPAKRAFGPGHLARPLLDVPREALQAFATAEGLEWVDDPSNNETLFDRNYLRQAILPALSARWPDAGVRLRASASLMAECQSLLDALAAADLERAGGDPACLDLDVVRGLPAAQQRNLLRYAVRRLDLPLPPRRLLALFGGQFLDAGDDRMPLLRWAGAEIRRYRQGIYIAPPADDVVLPERWHGESLDLGVLGRLELVPDPAGAIPAAAFAQGLTLAFRDGGERLRKAGAVHSTSLKTLFQEAGVLPWMRDRIPLVFADGELLAVGDLWQRDAAGDGESWRVAWHQRPLLTESDHRE